MPEISSVIETGLSRFTKEASFHGTERAKEAREIALTFDDGPDPVRSLDLIDALNARRVKATFFWFADKAQELKDNDPDLFKQIIEGIKRGGHEIGLHGDYRLETVGLKAKVFGEIDEEKMAADKAKLEELTGTEIKVFRPHNLQIGPVMEATIKAAQKLGIKDTVALSIGVGVRAEALSPDQIRRISLKIEPADIVGIHERQGYFGAKYISELERDVPSKNVGRIGELELKLGRQLSGRELAAALRGEGEYTPEPQTVITTQVKRKAKKEVTSPLQIVSALIDNLKKGHKFVTTSEVLE